MFARIPGIALLLLCLACATACEVDADPAVESDQIDQRATAASSTVVASATSPTSAPSGSESTPVSETEEPDPVVETWTVIRVIDGDTIEVESSSGIIETIRIVGIDAPESGQCGFEDAADA